MEEIINNVFYFAVFDPDTYQVIKVGPSSAFLDEKNKILLDESTALDIIEGKIKLFNCYVDVESNSLELVEKQYITKIDDVLHRIIEKKWTKRNNFEIFLTYNKKTQILKFELTSAFSGTKKINFKNKRRIHWDGNTEMNFYITEYNDPHVLLKNISFPVNKLINNFLEIKIENPPEKFSVYTKRLFKEYVIELK
jgi:hypothetical protein